MAKKKPQHGGKREGAGRKSTAHPEGRTKPIGGSVPTSLVEQLDEWAKKNGVSRSGALTEAIRRLVKND